MIEHNKILAGIVLYNPDIERLKLNIQSCIEQVDKIILVDNGSQNFEKIELYFGAVGKIDIVRNSSNLGIAKALNQILETAINLNFDWFLTLDQDSVMDKNCVIEMNKVLECESIGIVCPQYRDVNLNIQESGCITDIFNIINNPCEVIQSGSLIKTCAAVAVGRFDEKLFIDYVDIDFNERIIRSGYKIMRVNSAVLFHELGKAEYRFFFGIKIFVDNHNAFRRYYITRNRLYIKRKYYGEFAYLRELAHLLLTVAKITLYEDDKGKKLSAIKRGVEDSRRM